MRIEPVVVVTGMGRFTFQAEIAATEAERQRGLMYRDTLGAAEAMLFDFGNPRPANFWMKSTYVSLDLIFIRADGSVAGIHEKAAPESLAIIAMKEPVLGVLEVVAGTAARIGLKPGDRVEHPMFRPGD